MQLSATCFRYHNCDGFLIVGSLSRVRLLRVGLDYDAWVHAPTTQKKFRMFHSDVLEFGSSTPWYVRVRFPKCRHVC